MTGLLVGGALAVWLVAALLRWVIAPRAVADPAFAGGAGRLQASGAGDVAGLFGAFASVGAVAGAGLLMGLGFTWLRPRRAAGRVLLLVAGLLATAGGLLLAAIGSLEIGWGDGAAVAGVTGAAVFVAVGLLAAVASASDRLPGPSLIERMMPPRGVHPATPAWERMLPLTVILAVGWVLSTGAVLARGDLVLVGFLVAQWGLPVLAGVIAAGWREGRPNRFETLGLASAAGTVLDWLFLLALVVGQYYHNLDGTPHTPPSYVVWWGLMGASFGAIGYSLWGPLARLARLARRRPLKPRRPARRGPPRSPGSRRPGGRGGAAHQRVGARPWPRYRAPPAPDRSDRGWPWR
jgi:hypothetical protein